MDISLTSCSLFEDIDKADISSLLECLGAYSCLYKKSEFVFRVDEEATLVGLVISGSVNVIQEDYWGNRTILSHFGPGKIFGEAYSCVGAQRYPVSVIAAEDSETLMLDYRKIITTCHNSCAFHNSLIANMLSILASNNIALTKKLEHVSRRTLREKLLSFLSFEAIRSGNNTVTIPFNRQELAEFLCVDRSALSRELGSMKKAGLIDYRKNRFTLL